MLKVPCEFSIPSVTVGIGSTVLPETCRRTTDVILHMLSTWRTMSSDTRFGHICWFLLFDSSGTNTLQRDTEWIHLLVIKEGNKQKRLIVNAVKWSHYETGLWFLGGGYNSHLLHCTWQLQKWQWEQEAKEQEFPVVLRADRLNSLLKKIDLLALSNRWGLRFKQ